MSHEAVEKDKKQQAYTQSNTPRPAPGVGPVWRGSIEILASRDLWTLARTSERSE